MQLAIAAEFTGGGVRILERGGMKGRLHYHVLLDVGVDVRTGYDFEASRAQQKENPRAVWRLHASANNALRAINGRLYEMARMAGFGVVWHCEPVRSEAAAVEVYLSKYVSKHVGQRLEEDKGRRLVGYFGEVAEPLNRSIPSASGFSFGGALTQVIKGEERPHYRNAWAWIWRAKVKQWMSHQLISDLEEARAVLGPHWAYKHGDQIRAEKLTRYPRLFMAILDGALRVEVGTMDDICLAGLLAKDIEIEAHDKTPKELDVRDEALGFVGFGTWKARRVFDSADVLERHYVMEEQAYSDSLRREFTVIWSDGRVSKSLTSIESLTSVT
jgi:hypothetical protein